MKSDLPHFDENADTTQGPYI